MHSMNKNKITECLLVAIKMLVWKHTQRELSNLYIMCHKWNAGQNHKINISNKSFVNILECVRMLRCPKFYPGLKYQNPCLFPIAIPSASSQLSLIPNLQQWAEHHNTPQQSVQKQQHCNISHFSCALTLLSLVLIILCQLNFVEFCGLYLKYGT